jgi:hypothetical protein
MGEIYLSSFFAVAPDAIKSLPVLMVRRQGRAILESTRPLLVFAQVGSAGESMLACLDMVGLRRHALGNYAVHAAVVRPIAEEYEVVDVEPGVWADEARRLAKPGTLWCEFDRETLAHFASSPDPRRFLAATKSGQVLALSISGVSTSVSQSGVHQSTVLHHVRVAPDASPALAALIAGAGIRAGSKIVVVPNVSNLEPGMLRSVGLRATPASFSGWMFTNDGNELGVKTTDFEIV